MLQRSAEEDKDAGWIDCAKIDQILSQPLRTSRRPRAETETTVLLNVKPFWELVMVLILSSKAT
eukprot:2948514-Amphidinium_carterae.2